MGLSGKSIGCGGCHIQKLAINFDSHCSVTATFIQAEKKFG